MSIDVKYMRSTYESESWSTLPGKSPSTFKGAVTSQETTGHYTSYTVDNVVKVKTVSDRVRKESTSYLSRRESIFKILSISLTPVIASAGTLTGVALAALAFVPAAVFTGIALAALGLFLHSNKQRDLSYAELKKWDKASLLPAMEEALVDLNHESYKLYRDLNSELFSLHLETKKFSLESKALMSNVFSISLQNSINQKKLILENKVLEAHCKEAIRKIKVFQNAFDSNLQNNMNHRFV